MTREHTPAGPCTFEITAFTKHGGPLTKRVPVDPSGKMISDGSACIMSHGGARRVRFDSLTALRSSSAVSDQMRPSRWALCDRSCRTTWRSRPSAN